jgi:hypothetical protein
MSKGATPELAGIERLFRVAKSIWLSIPCVGRLPYESYPKAIAMGITKN